MIQWVSNERATIAKLVEHGRLWIVDKLPPLGLSKYDIWEISANEGDTRNKLIRRWADTSLPHGNEASEQQFIELLKASVSPILVLHNADFLKGGQLVEISLFLENYAPVVLVGDVLTIGAKAVDNKNAAEFMQKAKFCITPTMLF
ncbi:MAG: hypothetical protein ACU85E_15795 [Gammaproteobacteria bacterium]